MKMVKLEEKHLVECSLLYIDTFNCEPWNDNWDEESSYKRLRDIYDTPGFIGYVVIEDGKIVGAVLGNQEPCFEGNMYNLKEMFVNKNEKRKGIGSYLMNELEKKLKEQQTTSITLFTTRGDMTESFYIKNGFKTDEEMIMMDKKLV